MKTSLKARNFFLIAVGVFAALFTVRGIRGGFEGKAKTGNKALEFHLVKEEKPFVVIIPSYNNEDYVEKNLWSVLEQEYENFRVIFIDDGSTDDTFKRATDCVESFNAGDGVTFIRNQTNYKALYNLYYAIQSLPDETIVVIVDGDDWLSHSRVLKELNRYYNDPNTWMTYGQYITYPKYEKGKPLFLNSQKRNLRGEITFPQLRTFYAGLFKQIKLKDLLYKGDFFKASWDSAVMFPMWEMAREHSVFIPDILYVYNRESPLNDDKIHKEKQRMYNRYISSLAPYSSLEDFKITPPKESGSALIVFSENRPMQLLSFLESLEKESANFYPIHIFYTAKNGDYEKGYEIVKEAFGDKITLHHWDGEISFTGFIHGLTSEYITFAKDTLIASHKIEVDEAIQLLEKTGAYALYFDLGLNIEEIPSKVLSVGDGSFIWDYARGESTWKLCNRLDMTLYRKASITPFLSKIHFNTIAQFESKWQRCVDLHQIGLFYKESKVINVPFQVTKLDTYEKTLLYTEAELNDRLLEGYKIDIDPLEEAKTSSREIEFYPHFIKRE